MSKNNVKAIGRGPSLHYLPSRRFRLPALPLTLAEAIISFILGLAAAQDVLERVG